MSRGHVEFAHAAEVAAAPLAGGWPAGAELRVLSRDSVSGAFTGVVELPAGYRRGAGSLPHASELLVLSGTLAIGARTCAAGFYEYTPADVVQEPWRAEAPVSLLLRGAGPPQLAVGGDGDPAGRIRLDTHLMPWTRSTVPGPPPGMFSKTLRHDAETGERVFVCGSVRRFEYPLVEYHDCHEEAFQISGDMRIGTSGLMGPGSYFWRPPYVSHGPFYSREGMVTFMTVDGPLVNHYVDDPSRTVEQNRAEALAGGPPRDYFAESRRGATA